MRIVTPEKVAASQVPMVKSLMLRISEGLTAGKRSFFTTNVPSELGCDIPNGYLIAIKDLLEKSGWIVRIEGTEYPIVKVASPKEAKGY